MLLNVPKILSPELIKVLAEMGHGDSIVLADANFPCHSICARVVRADGIPMPALLDAVMQVIPLDDFIPQPVSLMLVADTDDYEPVMRDSYPAIIGKHTKAKGRIAYLERFAFYEKAKQAYAVVATGETARYGNIILQKGVID